jgi:tRNA threonylcarbamoyladenosine biosynthesis protein TsaB
MSLILSLETSTEVGSVALHKDGKLLTTSEIHIQYSHASKLAVLIDQVLTNAGVNANQLNAVAVTSGPGSYTGLRIGTSTAKGLCFALDIPLLSVGSLELMAYQVSKSLTDDILLCPMIDARRMEVYCLVANRSLEILQATQPVIIEADSFAHFFTENRILFFGNGAAKCKDVMGSQRAMYLDDINPQASHLGELAFQKFQQNEIEDLINFEPNYLKEFLIKPSKALL